MQMWRDASTRRARWAVRRMPAVSMAVCMAIAAAACGDQGGTSAPITPAASQNNTGGNGNSGNGSNGTPGTNTSFSITPRALALLQGTYGELIAVDANGKVLKNATYRSSNPNVAVVGDTGVVYGKAVGSAAIFVTVGGVLDSAEVVVLDRTNVVAGVSSFNLSLKVVGTTSPGDTLSQTPIAGATVAVTRTVTFKGDTLQTPDPAVQMTTNAQGVARFEALPGGAYNIVVTPPAGSPYLPTRGSFFPPTVAEYSGTLLAFMHM